MTGTEPVPAVTAVICVYTEDRWDQIVAAVRSLREQTSPPEEILVVVDHNPTLEARARGELEGVSVHPNRHRHGLSGGRNTALALASAPVVAFLDDDAEAHPDWLEHLAVLFTEPAVMGAGGRVEPLWETGRPAWMPPEFDWVLGCSYTGLPAARAAVRNPFGGAMLIRRDPALEAGGYHVDLGRIGRHPLGCEETELCLRIRRADERAIFLFEPRAAIRHHAPRQRCTLEYFRKRCYAEGLSKATVRRLADDRGSLATERDYVRRTLPAAVGRGIADGLRGDRAGFSRAGVVVLGLTVTAAGFVRGSRAQIAPRPLPLVRDDRSGPPGDLVVELTPPRVDAPPAAPLAGHAR